jgi:hypothetical protein
MECLSRAKASFEGALGTILNLEIALEQVKKPSVSM